MSHFWENNNRKSFVESLLTFLRIWGGTSSKNSNFKKCWRINTELIFCLILKIIHFVIMDRMVLLQRFVTQEFLINIRFSGGMQQEKWIIDGNGKSSRYLVQVHFHIDKVGCVFPVVISSDFRMGQHRDSDHQENASHFSSDIEIINRWSDQVVKC